MQNPTQNPELEKQQIPINWPPMYSKNYLQEFVRTKCEKFLYLLKDTTNKDLRNGFKPQLEIEMRFGNFLPKDSTNKSLSFNEPIYQTLHEASMQSPNIVGTTDSSIKKLMGFADPYGKNNFTNSHFKYNFEPKIGQSLFFDRIDWLNCGGRSQVDKKGSVNQEPGKFIEDVTIDFLVNQKDRNLSHRLTFDILSGQCLETKKIEKTTVDYMNQRCDYRLSGSFEQNKTLTKEEFKKRLSEQDLSLIRVKFRKSYIFQWLTFDFTRIREDRNIKASINLMKFIIFNLSDSEEIMSRILTEFDFPENFEVEMEIKDTRYLQDSFMDKDPSRFYRVSQRFFNNAEVFYYKKTYGQNLDYDIIWTEMHEKKLQEDKLNENKESENPFEKNKQIEKLEVVYPQFGKYLESLKRQKFV